MNPWKGSRVLVTGATGFIGAHLLRRLAAEGARLHVLVRPSSSGASLKDLWERVEKYAGDLCDARSLEHAVEASRPQFVFHLAKDREGASFEREVRATWRLAAALRQKAPGLKR